MESSFQFQPQPVLTKDQFEGYKNWIHTHPNLTFIERKGLENDRFSIRVIDCKVACRGPDDKVYGSSTITDVERIRDEITRGCILLEIKDKETSSTQYHLFQGFAKFSGLTDQDDDDLSKLSENQTKPSKFSKSFFLRPRSSATTIFCTTKENGKAAHLACLSLSNQFYILAGSKNVHKIIQLPNFEKPTKTSNFDQPPTKSPLHDRICSIFISKLQSMSEKTRISFLSFLSHTKLLANFELMLPHDQHVVDYQLKAPLLRFLAFTGRRTHGEAYKRSHGLLVHPTSSNARMRAFGFQCAACTAHRVSKESYDAVMQKLVNETRNGKQSEGTVLYYADEKTLIFGLSKVKSVWYVLCRALREKLKLCLEINSSTKENEGEEKVIRFCRYEMLVERRVREIGVWLELSESDISYWRVYGHFLKLFLENELVEILKGEEDERSAQNILSKNYAVLLRKFEKSVKEEWNMKDEVEKIDLLVKDERQKYGGGKRWRRKNKRKKKKKKKKKGKGKGKQIIKKGTSAV